MTNANRPTGRTGTIDRSGPVPRFSSWPGTEKFKLGGVTALGAGLTLELAGMLTSGTSAQVSLVAGGICIAGGFATLATTIQR